MSVDWTPHDSTRRSAPGAAPDRGPSVRERFAAVETALEEIQAALAILFQRPAAVQTQLHRLTRKRSEHRQVWRRRRLTRNWPSVWTEFRD